MPKKRSKLQNPDATPIRDWIYGGLLFVIVAIMPLVVRITWIPHPPELHAIYLFDTPGAVDFFSYYKGWFLGVPSVFIILYFLLELFTDGFANFDFKSLLKSPVIIASCIFLLMVIVSTIFSSYRHTSWHGTVDRGEGLWILFAYFVVFLAAMFYVRKTKHAKLLMYGLAFSSIIMGLIGLSQFIDRDFFATDFGQWFLRLGLPHELREQAIDQGGVMVRFEFAYGTLYNPNPFGKYTAMVAPIMLVVAFVFDEKGWKGLCGRIAFLLAGGLMLIGVFGSRSLGGFVGIGAAVGVVVLTVICRFFYQMRKRKKEGAAESETQRKPWTGWAIGVGAVCIIVISLLFVPIINEQLTLVITRFDEALRGERLPMDDMVFEGNKFTYVRGGYERFSVAIEGEVVRVEETDYWLPEGDIIRVHDANGISVPLASRTEPANENELPTYVFDVPDFGRVSILRHPNFIIFRGIGLTMNDNELVGLAVNNSFIDMRERVPSFGFEGREHWGSNRGFIWSRTLPLLPSRTIIGSGPDTFTLIFPQNDLVPKMFLFGNPYIPVDKAHNVYLQTWVTTGGISALAQIFLFGFYLFSAFVQIIRSNMKEGRFLFGLQIGLLAGISAFCVGALSTDSTIGSSGVFYVLLGIGYGVVYMVRAMQKPDVVTNQKAEAK